MNIIPILGIHHIICYGHEQLRNTAYHSSSYVPIFSKTCSLFGHQHNFDCNYYYWNHNYWYILTHVVSIFYVYVLSSASSVVQCSCAQ